MKNKLLTQENQGGNMRDLILKRITEMRQNTGNFPRDTQRWRNASFNLIHVSDLKLDNEEDYSDYQVVMIFELITRIYHAQM